MFSPCTDDNKEDPAGDWRDNDSARGKRRESPRFPPSDGETGRILARIDEVAKMQAEQKELIRSLEQRNVLLLSTLSAASYDGHSASLLRSQQPSARTTEGQSHRHSLATNMSSREESVPLKPPSHGLPHRRPHRKASWTWDPQFQSDLDLSFKVRGRWETSAMPPPGILTHEHLHHPPRHGPFGIRLHPQALRERSQAKGQQVPAAVSKDNIETASERVTEKGRSSVRSSFSATQRLRNRWAEVKVTNRAVRCVIARGSATISNVTVRIAASC